MDFRRIEWIFLIVFMGLNIFLGVTFFQSQAVDMVASSAGNSEITADIARDQIKLPTLSRKVPTGGYLAAQGNQALVGGQGQLVGQRVTFTNDPDTTLHATLQTQVPIKKDGAVKALKKWVAEAQNVQFGDHYTYAKELSGGGKYVFVQAMTGHKMFDRRAQVVLTVTNNRLVSYTQTYIDKMTTLRGEMKLASEADAVITLYKDNELANNATVVWTQLAYSYLLDTEGTTVYVPTWFIGVESQGSKNVTVKKLNAITKTVIKPRDDNE